MEYQIISLSDKPEWKEKMAAWFSEKWKIPKKAYEDSMDACLQAEKPVPQWYVAAVGEKIIGGMGVIENDFHERKDLTPNICAVYVEKAYRCNGIAGRLLNKVCEDMAAKGIDTLYLLTDHDSFYERYDWRFLCMVMGDGEEQPSRMYIHHIEK